MLCLVGVDESDGARLALRWAQEFATTMSASLCAVRAWEYPSISVLPGPPALRGPAEVDAAVAVEVRDLVREELGERANGIEVRVERGPADYALLHAARCLRADTLVLGKRGVGTVTGRLLGSVSRRVAEHAPCPVIIVPTGAPVAQGPIVVGVDGSDHAADALRWAVEVAKTAGTGITVVHGFGSPTGELSGGAIRHVQARGQDLAEAHCQRVRDAGVDCRIVLDAIDPRTLIEHAADTSDARLIVVGTRGTGPIEALLLGSVATYLGQHSERPVTIVPPPRAR
jgi:nucleotide-binding universal stress UspA family protein